jgi:hypothetical protein
MYDQRTTLSSTIEQEIRKRYGELVFKTVIPVNVKLAEAPAFGQSIQEYAPSSSICSISTGNLREVPQWPLRKIFQQLSHNAKMYHRYNAEKGFSFPAMKQKGRIAKMQTRNNLDELAKGTIEKVLSKSDAELGLEFLLNPEKFRKI